ncbi:MAG: DUF6010 family protein [Archangium sp.]
MPVPHDVMDSIGPAIAALIFVLLMSRVPEPLRRRVNGAAVMGASGLYVSGGGFGVWELAYAAVAAFIGYRALTSYRFIAIGWWLHAAWDLVHHFWGNPLWSFMPTSSWGCVIFDSLIAIWLIRQPQSASQAGQVVRRSSSAAGPS